MSDNPDKTKSQLMKFTLSIITGCLLSCCLSIIMHNFYYGKKVVILDKNLNDYANEESIPRNNVTNVNMMQGFKWSIVPAIFNLIVWIIIIWFITKSPKTSDDN